MPKQHLESILSQTLRHYDYWYLKLQVNPLAHTCMPADYIVLTTEKKYLIECKETKSKRFDYSRLTQERGLLKFETYGNTFHSYLLLCFWKTTKKNSTYYLIPMKAYSELKLTIGKKSFNHKDAKKYFKKYTVTFISNKTLNINEVIKK